MEVYQGMEGWRCVSFPHEAGCQEMLSDAVETCSEHAHSGDHLALSGQHVPEEQLKWLGTHVPLVQTALQNLHGLDRGFCPLSKY